MGWGSRGWGGVQGVGWGGPWGGRVTHFLGASLSLSLFFFDFFFWSVLRFRLDGHLLMTSSAIFTEWLPSLFFFFANQVFSWS